MSASPSCSSSQGSSDSDDWCNPQTSSDVKLFNSILAVADDTSICWPQDWATIVESGEGEGEWTAEEKSDYKKFAAVCNANMIKSLKEMVEKLEIIQTTLVN